MYVCMYICKHVCMCICMHCVTILCVGAWTKIARLVKEHSIGCYPLCPPLPQGSTRMPDMKIQRTEHTRQQQPLLEKHEVCGSPPGPSSGHDESMVDHEFVVCVCGVNGMSVEVGMVWGEADCYVQYHFPTLTQPSVSDMRCPAADHGELNSLTDRQCLVSSTN